ncbi:MAG: cytochrome-c peroxidase [Burkholderiaceae bacterium]|nr:cytochrome-c peroxidase [Burkholderiaceae bacterium]
MKRLFNRLARWERHSRVQYVGKGTILASMLCMVIGASVFESKRHANAAGTEAPILPPSLKTIPVPGLSAAAIADLVQDKKAAIQLGKALFWDVRVGSDNKTACASCHFHAGADNRIKNQINPGLLAGDTGFDLGGPNYTLKASDFPLTRYADVNDAATMVSDKNDVVSSQGVFTMNFVDLSANGGPDTCNLVSDAVIHGGSGFNLGGVNTRRVEPRNAPTVFNAIFNFRNFWDGRANNTFNGGDPFGLRNPGIPVWKLEYGLLRKVNVALQSASLAALSSGPPMSENEMSCRARTFAKLGRKLLGLRPLANQTVAVDDSVLGALAPPAPSYGALIQRAFRPAYCGAASIINREPAQAQVFKSMDLDLSHPPGARGPWPRDQASQMEANFPLYFGVALQLYMATLVTDDTPYDRYAGGQLDALNAQQLRGLAIFTGRGQCTHCHAGPVLTSASTFHLAGDVRLDQRFGDNQAVFHYDNGFFNTGVRPTRDDAGVGGSDPYGNPLSETRMAQSGKSAMLDSGFNEAAIDPAALTAVDGAFKTPGLRNVELTGPYFHNGGKATLMQVVDFYNRGGDFGLQNRPLTDPTIHPLGLSEDDKRDLVAFLLSLTDERVRFEKAPFDHPSICLPHGHVGGAAQPADKSGNAIDVMECGPEVGAGGSKTALSAFLGLSPYQH